jgi:alkaline phosphatase
MRKFVLCVALFAASLWAADRRAKNVILFIGDAGGIPILNAAAALKGQPQSLFIQHMPHMGLMETSTASEWLSDSAAAMTAIVTGQKTHNGVISQSTSAVKGKSDGEALKTILEYAEEQGASTGVITDDDVTGATPAACYAHANDRKKAVDIFSQVLKPRYGDGVDILIGEGKTVMAETPAAEWGQVEGALRRKGYSVLKSVEEFQPTSRRAVVLLGPEDFDMNLAVRRAREILSRNPKGYFLMVEVDLHTTKLQRGLERTLYLDRLIEETVRDVKSDTLVIFAADHSFDTRLIGGKKGDSLAPSEATPSGAKPAIRIGGGHSAEEVLVAAQGPGAELVRGFFPNTQLFRIMMAAYGWDTGPKTAGPKT